MVGPVKIVASIERTVAQELIGAAVKAVGAGASDGADDAARRSPVFSALIRGQNGKLGDGVDSQVAAQDAAGSLVGVVVDADPIQKIIVLLRATAADRQLDSISAAQTVGAGDRRHGPYGGDSGLKRRQVRP